MNSSLKVRLNKEYIDEIKNLAKKYFNSEEVIIFGSRADLNKTGWRYRYLYPHQY